MGFIDSQRELGHAVESICRVLTSQGCRIAARTYRAWKHAAAPTRGEVDLAHTINAILDAIRNGIMTKSVCLVVWVCQDTIRSANTSTTKAV